MYLAYICEKDNPMSIDDPSRSSRLRRGCKVLEKRHRDATIHELTDHIACIFPHGDSIALYEDYVHFDPSVWVPYTDERQSLELALLLVERLREAISRTDFQRKIVTDPGSHPSPDEDQ
jgi:hypothetical protein